MVNNDYVGHVLYSGLSTFDGELPLDVPWGVFNANTQYIGNKPNKLTIIKGER